MSFAAGPQDSANATHSRSIGSVFVAMNSASRTSVSGNECTVKWHEREATEPDLTTSSALSRE